ncbi:hypothetical protein M9458_010057, partial [Cirrhinus mrigala]
MVMQCSNRSFMLMLTAILSSGFMSERRIRLLSRFIKQICVCQAYLGLYRGRKPVSVHR